MIRNIRRELHLEQDEVEAALRYWLVEKHDIQLGTDLQEVEFRAPEDGAGTPYCTIITESEDERDLLEEKP